MSGAEVGLALSVLAACAVEAVEALTIVLAVGATRCWRSALSGVGAALVVLAVITAALGPAVTALPLGVLRVVVGGLLLDIRPAVAAQGDPARQRAQGPPRRAGDI